MSPILPYSSVLSSLRTIKALSTFLIFLFMSPISCPSALSLSRCPLPCPFFFFLMVLVSAVTLGCIHTPEDLELGAQTRENMLFLPFCINSLNIWSLLGIILCKHQVICTGILTFRNLLTQAFFLILEKCKSLPNNVTSFEVESLKPYKYYEVSLLAYVNGKIQRNGTAEKCNFHTKADRKFLALIFLP